MDFELHHKLCDMRARNDHSRFEHTLRTSKPTDLTPQVPKHLSQHTSAIDTKMLDREEDVASFQVASSPAASPLKRTKVKLAYPAANKKVINVSKMSLTSGNSSHDCDTITPLEHINSGELTHTDPTEQSIRTINSGPLSLDAGNSLIKSAHTRNGHWISKELRALESKKVRFEARNFYNENRQMAIALGKVFAEDIALKSNEKQILYEKHQKVEDKIGEERRERVKQTENVFKIPKDQFKI